MCRSRRLNPPTLTLKRSISMSIYHKHHIIPRHMGGSDDPSNLIELTIEKHAAAHKKLWEEHGRWQDELAYKGLCKLLSQDEISLQVSIKANQNRKFTEEHRNNISNALKGHKLSYETRLKISKTRKMRNIKPKQYKRTSEIRQKMSESSKNRAKIICSCGKTVDVSNHGRWHKNCLPW